MVFLGVFIGWSLGVAAVIGTRLYFRRERRRIIERDIARWF